MSGVYKEIHKNIMPVEWNDIGVEKSRRENYAHIADVTVLTKLAGGDCSLHIIKETFYKMGLGFAVSEGWPYKPYMDTV